MAHNDKIPESAQAAHHNSNASTRTNKDTQAQLLVKIRTLRILLRDKCRECQSMLEAPDANERSECTVQVLRKKHIVMQTHVCAVRRAIESVRCWDSDGKDKAPGAVLVPCVSPFTRHFSDQFSNVYDCDKRYIEPLQEYIHYGLKDDLDRNRRQLGHRLIYGAHFVLGAKLTIDHGDQCKSNNDIVNLEALSRSDHAIKTNEDNPHIADAYANKIPVRGTCTVTGVVSPFESWSEAAMLNDLTEGRQLKAYFDKGIPYKGKMWEPVVDTNMTLVGEVWYKIVTNVTDESMPVGTQHLLGLGVSNLGRVQLANGTKTFGHQVVCEDDCSRTFNWNGKVRNVAQAICTAFDGPCPESGTQVAHYNGICSDNCSDNVTWARGGTIRKNGNTRDPPTAWAVRLDGSAAATLDTVRIVASSVLQHMLGDSEIAKLQIDGSLLVPLERISESMMWFKTLGDYEMVMLAIHDKRQYSNLAINETKKRDKTLPLMSKLLRHAKVTSLDRTSNSSKRPRYNIIKLSYDLTA